jgi:cupin fold WbuC family metalloprotein
MKTRTETDEVLYAEDPIVSVSDEDLEYLKQKADLNFRQRIRLCSHPVLTDNLHEMLIVHKKNVYIRPHKHPGKSESIHIIEGFVDVVVFNDDGSIFQVLPLGEYGSGRVFYCRMNSSVYHTLLIHSEILVFHETTNGPFQKGDTQFAPWSPDSSDAESCKKYVEKLDELVASFMKNKRENF